MSLRAAWQRRVVGRVMAANSKWKALLWIWLVNEGGKLGG